MLLHPSKKIRTNDHNVNIGNKANINNNSLTKKCFYGVNRSNIITPDIYHVKGFQCDEKVSPLMLPSYFKKCKDLDPNSQITGTQDYAQKVVEYIKYGKSSKFTKRKYIYGAYYDQLYPGYFVLDTANYDNKQIELEVKLASGETSVVRIGTTDADIKSAIMLNTIVNLGLNLPSQGNVRRHCGDEGQMYALGYKDPCTGEIYLPMLNCKTALAMRAAATSVGKYMQKHWNTEYNNIVTAEYKKCNYCIPLEEMGGRTGPGNVLMFSKNLANSSHVDYADNARSFVMWAEDMPNTAENWCFILPDVW